MPPVADDDSQKDFAHAFGDALNAFLNNIGMGQSEAARLFELEDKHGKANRARLHSYCHDSSGGRRPRPDAEILYLACTKLPGFYFDYRGYRISAATLDRDGSKRSGEPAKQLTFHFDRQFNLTEKTGKVKVRVKRPPGRIELFVSLDAKA